MFRVFLLCKFVETWHTLGLILLPSHTVSRVMMPWFCFGFGVLLPLPFALQPLCHHFAAGFFWDVGVAEQAHFDLCMTFAPVGHHVPFQPLVTGPHLHPSPASSPSSSSSPSILPSSSQSSVTGPPRFSFSYSLFPHDFLLVEEKAL